MHLAKPAIQAPPIQIPFSKPSIGEEEIGEVVECLRSGWITSGPRCQRFEREVADYVRAPHAVAVSSATAGLHLLMSEVCRHPGDEVITTTMTWPATVNAIVLAGGRPVLADVDPETLNLDLDDVARRLTNRTVAIVPVHFAGQAVDVDALRKCCAGRDVRIIEDAAHALGSELRGKPIGSDSDAAVFSFHPIKNITTAEGGMIVTADEELSRRLRLSRFHGVERDAWGAYGTTQLPHYDVVSPGFKYNMTDMQAALGLHQLQKLDVFIERRAALAARYDEALRGLPGIEALGRVSYPIKHAHHLYVVRVAKPDTTREEVMVRLIESGVGVGLHFLAVHRLTYYRNLMGDLSRELPVATRASEQIFSLPLHPSLTDAEQDYVIETLSSVMS